MEAPLAILTGMNALDMDSEGGIVDIVLGTEFLTMTDERAIIKLGLTTGSGSSHGKSVQATIRFCFLHTVYDYLDRLATASKRTASLKKLRQVDELEDMTSR